MILTNIYKLNLLKTATIAVIKREDKDLVAYAQGVEMIRIKDADEADLKKIKKIVQLTYNGYGCFWDENPKLPKKIKIKVEK